MPKLSATMRVILTAVATTIAVIASTAPHLPGWAQGVITGLSVVLAAFGIIPPHVPVTTTVHTTPSAGTWNVAPGGSE